MKKLSKVTVKQGFIPKQEYALADVCNGKYKPLTQKEMKVLNELFNRYVFNEKGWCMVSHNGITRPLFVHQYKRGKVAPKSKIESIWRDGNVDPKYILTTNGFVLAGDNYNNISEQKTTAGDSCSTISDSDPSQWSWTNGVESGVFTFNVDYVATDKKQ